MACLAFRRLRIAILILGLTGHICCAAKISETPCTVNGNECTVQNSECDTGGNAGNLMCKCSAGFVEDTPGTACVSSVAQTPITKITETPCTVNGNECTMQHSECDTGGNAGHLMCKCSAGFVEDTPETACVSSGGQTPITKITETPCSVNGNECTMQHSECDTGGNAGHLMCKCSAGFVVDTPGTACVSSGGQTHTSKITETQCTSNGGECKVQHSECDTGKSKCKCSDGFVENTPAGTSCVPSGAQTQKKRVSELVCSNNGAECNSIEHSTCDVPKLKCKCKTTFAEDRTDGSTCVLTLDNKPCTSPKGTECGSNAECVQSKCRCSAGFKMNVDTCVADNGGATRTLTFAILAIPLVLAMREAFGLFM